MGPPREAPKRVLTWRGCSGSPLTLDRLLAALRLRFCRYSYAVPWSALPPLLTTELNWPPEEWTNSGEIWFCCTLNSATASLGRFTNGPVTLPLLLSMPSMVKLLLRGRCPPTDGPAPRPIAPLVPTPAFRSARLSTPYPPDTLGSSDMALSWKVFCTEAVVVSIEAAEAETSTVSTLVPTSSFTLLVAVWFNATPTPLIWAFVKPVAVTVIVYVPGCRLAI